MVNWFGPSWFSPMNKRCPRVDTPVGDTCSHCNMKFHEGDRGITMPSLEAEGVEGVAAFHLACFLLMIGIDVMPGPPE
jgi:hypothetical protein